MTEKNDLYARIEENKPWVLLVDDDANILDTVKDILEDEHYIVATASTGTQALKLLGENNYNVVVVDFQLPDSTGLELARKIREHHEDTCVILMTGHASLEMAVKAIQEAVYDYLIKPVDPALLQRTIQKALEKQRLSLENKRLLKDLRETNQAIARLDDLKSKMLTVMSHDLRTPLASIRGYADLLSSGTKGKLTTGQKEILEITMHEADHINGLIGDLLDLASIEAGRLMLETRPIKFGEVIMKILPRVKLSGEMKGVSVDVVSGASSVVVDVDVNRMVQVLSNLVRGSIRHSPRNGRVFVNTLEKEGMMEMRISHAGQGFTREQLVSLFPSDHNLGEQNGTHQDGFRIGLAIGREIIHAHGGEIGVESTGIDQGATFWIKLPVAKNGK
jgi:signal transduction histidine kinase